MSLRRCLLLGRRKQSLRCRKKKLLGYILEEPNPDLPVSKDPAIFRRQSRDTYGLIRKAIPYSCFATIGGRNPEEQDPIVLW